MRKRVEYGPYPEQFGHLYVPRNAQSVPRDAQSGAIPVVMLIHGGYWSSDFRLNLSTSFAVELSRRGVAVWNIEYRRLGAGGGWDEMSADVLAAFEAIDGPVADASPIPLDRDHVRVVGHSAGAQLAVWLAGEKLASLQPELVVSQAGALDLVSASSGGRRTAALAELFGAEYDEAPQRYRSASPLHRLPIGVPVTCIHGACDLQVPVSMSRAYCDAARAVGDQVELYIAPDEGHAAFLKSDSESWRLSRDAVLADLDLPVVDSGSSEGISTGDVLRER